MGARATEAAHSFDDSAAYERFIGRWGRAAGTVFLDWLSPPAGARWLDIGCGTGLFTELIVDTCSPAAVLAIDQAQAQIDRARGKPVARRADFRVGDALALPYADSEFDVVVSALAINFIPDRPRALSEMRRVVRPPDGLVAGYVWDFSAELSPSGPFRLGMRRITADVPVLPGTADSQLDALASLFNRAGFVGIATKSIDVTVSFPDFEAFWLAQTPSYSPMTKMIAAMTNSERVKLVDAVRAELAVQPDGRIEYPARANAIKASAQG
jgi:ubiquinone/menaquinone biosynthesis C-methylase UbiE